MEQLREGIWAIAQPFASRAEIYTLDYIIEDDRGDLHLIDPGANLDENFVALHEQLRSIGHDIEDVATITLTHLHHDHLGLAERVRRASGARIALHREEQAALDGDLAPFWANREHFAAWGLPPEAVAELGTMLDQRELQSRVTADVLLEHDELLAVPGRELRVIHTPGHTVGHICIASGELLFTGDHVLPNQFPGIGLGGDRGTNPLEDMIASLEAIAPLDRLEVCPGHGWRFRGLAERCDQTLAHHNRRTAEVAAVLEREPEASVWEIASQLTWTAGWDQLKSFYLGSALGQTHMHRARVLTGNASRAGGG